MYGERRSIPRLPIRDTLDAVLFYSGEEIPCYVTDISEYGIGFKIPNEYLTDITLRCLSIIKFQFSDTYKRIIDEIVTESATIKYVNTGSQFTHVGCYVESMLFPRYVAVRKYFQKY